MRVSLLIPCKDEAEALPPLLLELARLPSLVGDSVEVVFVDDGSTDSTAAQLARASDVLPFRVVVETLPENRGLGGALRAGVPRTEGQIVVTYDADRAYPLDDIVPMIQRVVNREAQVVTASPWHPEGSAEHIPPHRLLISKLASRVYGLRLGARGRHLHTFTCGFRAYDRATLLAALPRRNGFVATAEVLVNALSHGATVVEHPAVLRTRTEGQSKMRVVRTAWAHLGLVIFG